MGAAGVRSASLSIAVNLILFATGGTLLYFANGVDATPLAAWLAPALLLRFSRKTPALVGLPAIGAVAAVTTWLAFRSLIPVPQSELVWIAVSSGLVFAFIYAVDRFAAPRLSGVASTLVFPAATVAVLHLGSLGSPFGTWANDAYVQYDLPWLARMAAVAGIWGVAFMPAWFGSVVNQWAEGGFRRPWTQGSIAAFVAVLAAVLAHGHWLGASTGRNAEAVTVGLVGGRAEQFGREPCAAGRTGCLDEQAQDARMAMLLVRSEALVERGAEIVAWAEGAAAYRLSSEPEILARLARFAAERNVYLVAGLAAYPAEATGLIQNKVVIFAPDGRRSRAYFKAFPVPGEPVVRGDGRPVVFDTSHGRIGLLICFDADFTAPARAAARAGAEMIVLPSNDWADITPLHAEMAAFRAIELGVPILRPTTNGLTAVIDARGAVVAGADAFRTPGTDVLSTVAPSRSGTLQGRLGDWFGWLCVVLLVGLSGLACVAWVRRLAARRQARGK